MYREGTTSAQNNTVAVHSLGNEEASGVDAGVSGNESKEVGLQEVFATDLEAAARLVGQIDDWYFDTCEEYGWPGKPVSLNTMPPHLSDKDGR